MAGSIKKLPSAEQARRRLSRDIEADLRLVSDAPSGVPTSTNLAELQQRLDRVKVAVWVLHGREEKLRAQAKAADERIAELEGELGSAREALVVKERENRSLQVSLTRLEAALARAATAEKLLAEERQRLPARTVEASRAVTKLADAKQARDAAGHTSVRTWQTCDTAIAGAEQWINLLSDTQVEAARPAQSHKPIQKPNAPPQRDRVERTNPKGLRTNVRSDETLSGKPQLALLAKR
jgi:chromosome segregation ATPase